MRASIGPAWGRVRTWPRAAWAFLRELSGEAALERRMRACACANDPVRAAWEETFTGIHRCC